MYEQQLFVWIRAVVHEGLAFLQQAAAMSSASIHKPSLDTSVAVAITAVAGVAVAAVVGGTLIYNRRLPFRRRRKRRSPLTEKYWRDAFDSESGRLIHQHKVLKKIRRGGIEPGIRAEVWLFLLGFYDLDSTQEEREAEKCRKRDVFKDLQVQCRNKRKSITREALDSEGLTGNIDTELGSDSSLKDGQEKLAKNMVSDSSGNVPTKGDGIEDQRHEGCKHEVVRTEGTPSRMPAGNAMVEEGSLTTTEEFVTWQRIIRLDAVRMNAEWVPYSPTQANVTEEVAEELASIVGLKDDEHLEPCRQHHAARLVGILEAYALYDPETGYCQGMSDLLCPFVALLDEDYQSFWCFVQFMNTARHNFRLDEIGIRRQLNKISSIFKVSDPHLYSHLESMEAQDCYFVYRMVVVLLRRELSFEQTLTLWEVIWAEKRAAGISHTKASWRKSRRKIFVADDFILFVIASAVRQKRKIIEKCKGMDEILRECNSMAGHLDVWSLLDDARELVYAVQGRICD